MVVPVVFETFLKKEICRTTRKTRMRIEPVHRVRLSLVFSKGGARVIWKGVLKVKIGRRGEGDPRKPLIIRNVRLRKATSWGGYPGKPLNICNVMCSRSST